MTKLDETEKQELIDSDCLCIYETWHLKTPPIPGYLEESHVLILESFAVNDRQMGRASGGIILFTKKNIRCTLIEKTEYWILVEISKNSENLTLGIFYFKPGLIDDVVIHMMNEVLERIDLSRKIVLAGDFNARIGNMNQVDSEILAGTRLTEERQSKDKLVNKRGEKLTELMENYGIIVLNGRLDGDIPGEYTFVDKKGVSTVDLVWVNILMANDIRELKVTEKSLHSDHLPLRLQLEGYEQEEPEQNEVEETTIKKYIWDEEKKKREFAQQLENGIDGNIYLSLKNAIHTTSVKLNMTLEKKISKNTNFKLKNKPWYNKLCRNLKFKMRQEFRKWKRNEHNPIHTYLEAKKQYKETVKEEAKKYEQNIQKVLANVKNSTEFWKEINRFRGKKKYVKNVIPIETWDQYLHSLFDQAITSPTLHNLKDARHEKLDAEITMDELHLAILKLKNNKTPGPDGIINEQMKNLNSYWCTQLLRMYNKILNTKEIPEDLANLDMTMIHKKGSKTSPENYRSIALLNNIFKIFTQILASRIYDRSEESNIINDGQMGFRKQRGCQDGIFVLAAIISLRMQSADRKVYAAFVDYKRAFSSVPHENLWKKLFKIGLSSNIIQTISALYQHAKAKVKVDGKHTNPVKVTVGVLEGDPLSALAFILYISDLEDFLRQRQARGISVNHTTDIILLMYADDVVLLADSRIQLQRTLDLLGEYCDENKLTVNTQKTNIVIFKKGRPHSQDVFRYKSEKLENTNTFIYLGVKFSSSGLFRQVTQHAKMKASIANTSVINALVKSRTQHWDTRKIIGILGFATTVLKQNTRQTQITNITGSHNCIKS